MQPGPILLALLGGLLLGTATSALLAFEGSSDGLSGMIQGLFRGSAPTRTRRAAFLMGLVATGLALRWITPAAFATTSPRPFALIVLAGLMIGFGARLANGCTSGHGIVGVARLSPRSIAAITIFSLAAAATVAIFSPGARS